MLKKLSLAQTRLRTGLSQAKKLQQPPVQNFPRFIDLKATRSTNKSPSLADNHYEVTLLTP
ncbi:MULTISPECIES: hypothetical protein [Mangrovibacter]|uniref:hypothetical protein n=1 Tax=Mangrovibacter TaxID=451512 RepID=UPI0004DAED00|nr:MULTISPECIES: hypothetical protein [Mangrovibacter]KEA52631.1 hypothetical protein DT73_11040 [Mangrovibacter sp. MFB070]